MSLRHLKTARVVVSLLFFVPAAFMFLDLTGVLPEALFDVLTALQVGPSIVKAFTTLSWGLSGLAGVLIVTLLFGRVYCSTLCPLGTLQDVFSRLNRKKNSRRRFRSRTQNYLLQYGLFLLAAATALGGSLLLLNLLEPFSNFGRAATVLARPIAVMAHNGVAWVLGHIALYSLYAVPTRFPAPGLLLLPLLFIATLFVLAYRYGRLFCNTLCPVGALLGLLSRVSLVRIAIDRHACRDCGLCEKVCKSECIDARNMTVDFSACVSCFNCMEVCPTVGLTYRRRGKKETPDIGRPVNRRRRKLMRDAAGIAAALAVTPVDSLKTVAPATAGLSRSTLPIAPPGSVGIEHLTSRCTACHLCVDVCPTQVLVPALFDYGLDGILQPHMVYASGACTYDCVLCGHVCPSGAILPLEAEQKKLVQIGKAKFIKDECVVVTKKTDCGACAEHCPTKAVRMVKYEGKLVIPELNNDLCVGCGACEHPCPTTPNKAIYVESNPLHFAAKKPEIKKVEPVPAASEDFPF